MGTSHTLWCVFKRPQRLPLIIAVICICLAGCSSDPPKDKDWVYTEWNEAMYAYHIVAVYPPNEDMHVGDIYGGDNDLYENDPEWLKNSTAHRIWLSGAIKLDSVSMTAELEKYYSKFPVFPDTTERSTDSKIWTQQEARTKKSFLKQKNTQKKSKATPGIEGASQSVFTPVRVLTKLPLAALPSFTISRSTSVSGGASIPLKFFKLLGSASAQKDLTVSLSIPTAEVYGVPAVPAYDKLADYCAANRTVCSTQFVRTMMHQQTGQDPQTTQVFIINRVYLTRSIEYTYESDSAIGAQGKALVDLHSALANQQALREELNSIKKSDDSALSVAPNKKQTQPSSDNTDATHNKNGTRAKLQTMLDNISEATADLEDSPVPGAKFTVGAVSENGISIIQTFERPVVIGYNAIRFLTQP